MIDLRVLQQQISHQVQMLILLLYRRTSHHGRTENAQVLQAPSRSSYSARESALFIYLLNNPSEKARYSGPRSIIDWEKFTKRWAHWCKVETALGSCEFKLRTKDQLKQKKKTTPVQARAKNVLLD